MTLDFALHPGVAMSGWDPHRADAVLRTASELGYRQVIVPLRGFESLDSDEIRDAFERHGVQPMTAGNQLPGADLSSDDAMVRNAGIERLRGMIEFTERIGGDQISGVLYGVLGHAPAPVSEKRFARTASILGQIADDAHGRGVRVVCEIVNRYETALMNTAVRGMEFTALSGSQHLHLHLDTFHMNIEERDPVEAVRTALPRLAFLEIGQNDRGALRGGGIDLPAFVASAVRLGYRGRFGVEAFSSDVLAPPVAQALAIWRSTFDEHNDIAADAAGIFRAI